MRALKGGAVIGQTGAPHEVWYRFNGRQLGYTGNNGTSEVSTEQSIAERRYTTPTNPGTYRNNSLYGSSYADFAQSYDPLNSYNQGSASGTYTVRAGESLQAIAQSLYGDASLWYKLAEANGLSAASGLIEGQTLILPASVMRNTHNASTFTPYNPADATDDLSPTTPANIKPSKKNKCGTFGMILLAVVAVAVTAIATAGIGALATGASFGNALGAVMGGTLATLSSAAVGATALGTAGAIAAGVAGAVVGSVVSQGLGVATGIQDKFSWKAVGMSALSAGIGGGIGQIGGLGSGVGGAAIRGALSSAVTQGVGVVTGLQDKFSWAGVAAAGIGAGIGEFVGGSIGGAASRDPITGNAIPATFGNFAASSAASAIANAATRSAINGESFGRNLAAAVPDLIASILQKAVGTAMDNVKKPGKKAGDNPTQGTTRNNINLNDPASYAPYDPEGDGHEVSNGIELLLDRDRANSDPRELKDTADANIRARSRLAAIKETNKIYNDDVTFAIDILVHTDRVYNEGDSLGGVAELLEFMEENYQGFAESYAKRAEGASFSDGLNIAKAASRAKNENGTIFSSYSSFRAGAILNKYGLTALAIDSAMQMTFGAIALHDNAVRLSNDDIINLKKTVSSEWVVRAGPDQAKGVIDTILNRLASKHWGNDVAAVVNARNQFSDINGPIARAHGWNSVEGYPERFVTKEVSDLVDSYLASRANGVPSSVGTHLNYANPAESSPSNLVWINKLDGPIFGPEGNRHVHGTTKEWQKFRPDPYLIILPK